MASNRAKAETLEQSKARHQLEGREKRNCPQCTTPSWAQTGQEPRCFPCIEANEGPETALEQADPLAHDVEQIILHGPDGGQHHRDRCRNCAQVDHRNGALEYTKCQPYFMRKYTWSEGRWRRWPIQRPPEPARTEAEECKNISSR